MGGYWERSTALDLVVNLIFCICQWIRETPAIAASPLSIPYPLPLLCGSTKLSIRRCLSIRSALLRFLQQTFMVSRLSRLVLKHLHSRRNADGQHMHSQSSYVVQCNR